METGIQKWINAQGYRYSKILSIKEKQSIKQFAVYLFQIIQVSFHIFWSKPYPTTEMKPYKMLFLIKEYMFLQFHVYAQRDLPCVYGCNDIIQFSFIMISRK